MVGILSNIWIFFLYARRVDFNLHLFSISKVEHLVICLRTICISFSKVFCCYLPPIFFYQVVGLFFSTFRSSLCIRAIISSLSVSAICVVNLFPCFVICLILCYCKCVLILCS